MFVKIGISFVYNKFNTAFYGLIKGFPKSFDRACVG